MNQDNPQTKVAVYRKRPLWQWGLIYLVVGGAVYAAIYAFTYRPAHGYSQPTNAASRTSAVSPPAKSSPSDSTLGVQAHATAPQAW